MIGTEIGGYRILEKLGEGGMGVVYKAVDISLDRIVAIKVLSPDLVRNPELVQRFRSEARAQANLNHTNLATLYAFIAQDNIACMVMELVDGETFEKMIERRGPIPALIAVPLFKQALLGIGYAHRAGIVHRDIKPSNLMVNGQGIVKVMDFGIAKVMGTRGMTRTGTQMGTGWYMSPEQVLNQNVDFRSDVYSLGVTLYQMLTAHVPFEGDSDFKIMSDQVNTPPPLPTRFYPYIPKGVENAVLKALEKNPDMRFQTVEEFGGALERPDDFAYVPAAVAATPPPPASATFVAPHETPAPMAAAAFTPPPLTPAPSVPPAVHVLTIGKETKLIAGICAALLLLLAMVGLVFKLRAHPEKLPERETVHDGGQTPLEHHLSGGGNGEVLSSGGPIAPKINSFRQDLTTVASGGKVHLAWSVSGASSISLSPGVGNVQPDGETDVPLSKTTEFTLLARNEKGETATKSALVTVTQEQVKTQPVPEPNPEPVHVKPAIVFRAIPNAVTAGGFCMLTWSVSNAQSVAIEPSLGVQQASGQLRLAPSETTTYTLTATSPDGSVSTANATVRVAEVPAPVIPDRPPPVTRASVVVNVFHDHGGAMVQGAWPSCWGQLGVVGNHLIYRVAGTNDGRRDGFDVQTSQVQEIRLNRMPIRGQTLFHITVNGQHLNFIAAGMGAMQAVSMLEAAMRR